jgi:hypothetical protein
VIDELYMVTLNPDEEKGKTGENKECAICLEELKPGQEISPMPCDSRHVYHSECAKKWFKTKT